MKERPILFSDPMVIAILSGQKTQTRRLVKPQPGHAVEPYNTTNGRWNWVLSSTGHGTRDPFLCPYGQPGDRLWVREAWRVHKDADHLPPRDLPQALTVRFEADGSPDRECGKYRPPMFMPRWACRLVLEIVSVRVERLQNISEADAMAEGCVAVDHVQWFEGMKPMADGSRVRQEFRGEPPSDWTEVKPLSSHDPLACKAKDAFRRLWYSINGAESWAANPWVWVIEFRRAQ